MKLSISAADVTVGIPACMIMQDIQKVTLNDIHLQDLTTYVI